MSDGGEKTCKVELSARPPRLAGFPIEPWVCTEVLPAAPAVSGSGSVREPGVSMPRCRTRVNRQAAPAQEMCTFFFLVDGFLRSIRTMRKPYCFACRPSLAKNVDLWQSARASRGCRGLHGAPLADRRRVSCLITVPQPRKLRYGASPSHPASLLPSPEIDIFSHFFAFDTIFWLCRTILAAHICPRAMPNAPPTGDNNAKQTVTDRAPRPMTSFCTCGTIPGKTR